VGCLLRIVWYPYGSFWWVLYGLIIKKKPWIEIQPDLQLAVFVSAVWALVYFVLLG
jgi:succinate-acetate transporter protein